MAEECSRTELVLKDKAKKLRNKRLAILGVGGVGGYVLEMCIRLGFSNILVVDCDKFEKSNLNRQILCTQDTIGQSKVDTAVTRAKSINPKCKIEALNLKIDRANVQFLREKFDYVIDCIDDVKAKISVIKFCKENNIPFLSAMGTGNRYKTPQFVVEDLFKTSYDGLARKIRTELKKEKINSPVMVVYTKEQPEKTQALGSVVYYPLMCAGVIVSHITNELINK